MSVPKDVLPTYCFFFLFYFVWIRIKLSVSDHFCVVEYFLENTKTKRKKERKKEKLYSSGRRHYNKKCT